MPYFPSSFNVNHARGGFMFGASKLMCHQKNKHGFVICVVNYAVRSLCWKCVKTSRRGLAYLICYGTSFVVECLCLILVYWCMQISNVLIFCSFSYSLIQHMQGCTKWSILRAVICCSLIFEDYKFCLFLSKDEKPQSHLSSLSCHADPDLTLAGGGGGGWLHRM